MSQYAPLYFILAIIAVGVIVGFFARYSESADQVIAGLVEDYPLQPFEYSMLGSDDNTVIIARSMEAAHAKHRRMMERGLGDDSQYEDDPQ